MEVGQGIKIPEHEGEKEEISEAGGKKISEQGAGPMWRPRCGDLEPRKQFLRILQSEGSEQNPKNRVSWGRRYLDYGQAPGEQDGTA